MNHYKVTKTSRIKPSTRAHESTKETRISNKQGTKTKGMETRSKPRGHKEERASFPDQFTYKVFTNPWLKSLTLEKRGEGQRGEEEGARLRRRRRAVQAKGEREGEGVFNPLTLD